MTTDATPDEAPCPYCGHTNLRSWTLCDHCGKQLPWAPLKRVLKVQDMTDEQLQARFAALPRRPAPYLLTPEGRPALGATVILVVVILEILREWLF